MAVLSGHNFENRFENITPKNTVILERVDYKKILKNNIMLNGDLEKEHHAVQKIKLNGVDEYFEFKVATNAYELKEILRLRFLSYSEEGYIDPNYFNEGLEYDKFDINSVMFLVRNLKTNNLHACLRLVLDSYMGLPLEELTSIGDFRSEDKVISEISRGISYPKGQRPINRAMLVFAYRFALNFGITHLVGFGRWDKLNYYENIGLRILEPLRKVKYRELENGHMPQCEFYMNVVDLKNFNFECLL